MRIKYLFLVLAAVLLSFRPSLHAGNNDNPSADKPLILIGDTQRTSFLEFWRERNTGVAKRMLQQVTSESPLAIIHLGDMVFNGTDATCWKGFEEDAKSVLDSHIPFHPVLGNHEYFLGHRVPSYVIDHFPDLHDSSWYSLRYGRLAVIMLNSNFSSLSKEQFQRQNTWYNNELQKFQTDSSVSWVIVCCHHAPYTNSSLVSDSKKVQENFVKPFVAAGKAKIFFSGHAHGYEHFVNYGKDFIVSAGGGGARPKLGKNNKDAFHRDIYKGAPKRDFNYCRLTVKDNHLLFEQKAWDGKNGNFYLAESFTVN